MIGNDSCGIHSILSEFHGPGPRTEHQLASMEVLTYDGLRLTVGPTSDDELERIVAEGGRRGDIYGRLRDLRDRHAAAIRARFPKILRRVSGYNLPALLPENGFDVARALCGTEGTCVTILDATVKLIPRLPARTLAVLGYDSVYDAGAHVPMIRDFRPVGLEGLDDVLIGYLKKKGLHPDDVGLFPEGKGFLLVEFGADEHEDAVEQVQRFAEAMKRQPDAPSICLYESDETQQRIWEVRESGLGATAFVPGEHDTWPGWEDSAVPVEHVGDYLRDLRGLFHKYDYDCALYGHFGQGCIHTRINFDLRSEAGLEKYRAFTREAAELVVGKYNGSLSGEHGDGQARGELLEVMYGRELVQAFEEFKEIWDPAGAMNPGKVVHPASRTTHLRLGADYHPVQLETHFRYPEDEGGFDKATLRCVGVGKCRREGGGTMCPSFQVLHEEQHTTRGRAHLLFEMLQGDVITDGWKSEPVKESLDLCLACKGCKGDCPVNVDMATYKAEFLSHYYDGRLRPRQAYAFGLIHWWARAGALAPAVANFFTQTPGVSRVARWAANVAPDRPIPRFAPRTFRRWFADRPRTARKPAPNGRVILWPDTFNDNFLPRTLAAATEVLEAAGFEVVLPRAGLCCGRPLYDYGMLDLAKRQLRQIMHAMRDEVAAGTPMVGMEPSCVSVFRDELTNLFPDNELASRLAAQTGTLGELLTEHAPDWCPPALHRPAVVHGHCHHKAIMRMHGERQVLDRLELDHQMLQSGCCGMAGAFGYESDKYDVSVAAGERVLLPAVRHAGRETLVVADGFSCREQVRQLTDREPMHLAEVLQLSLHQEALPADDVPERAMHALEPRGLRRWYVSPMLLGAGAVMALLGGVELVRARRLREERHRRAMLRDTSQAAPDASAAVGTPSVGGSWTGAPDILPPGEAAPGTAIEREHDHAEAELVGRG